MLKKLSFRITAALFAVIMFASINASANCGEKAGDKKKAALQTACTKTTDEELTKTIREQLAAEFKDQTSHVNVSVKNRTVTLEGWLDGQAAVAQAIAITKKIKCVRKVVSRLKEQGGGSCGPRQKPCGDICIDSHSKCTIDGQ